jgi:hypothetical protein
LTEEILPEAIRVGVYNAQPIPGVEFFGEPFFEKFMEISFWAFALRLHIGSHSEFVPQTSEWYALLEDTYPFGDIRLYPSKANGISATFPHQDLNSVGNDNVPWREGKLCLDTPVQRLGRIGGGTDPVGDYEERLRWYLRRALAWLDCAATNSLMQDGDPFEIPYYRDSPHQQIIHDETSETFQLWKPYVTGSLGVLVFHRVPKINNRELAVCFETMDGLAIRKTRIFSEEAHVQESRHRHTGFWWLWGAPVILPPWQAPTNWGELRTAGNHQGIDVDQILRVIARSVRGKGLTILLVGYPIPFLCGEEPREIYWHAIIFPALMSTKKPPKGFRATEGNFWERDRREAFLDKKELVYLKTENWHPSRMQARGRFTHQMCRSKVGLIGCGALGSIVCELLVREGIEDILLVDNKQLSAHNLVRHTLYGDDIGKNKANALVDRLSSAYPFSKIVSVDSTLPIEAKKLEALLMDRKVVIDCSGGDDVIQLLSNVWWEMPKLFVSASVGYKALRTFIFTIICNQFPSNHFRSLFAPLLNKERDLWAENGETSEGPGCWSPLFPARFDDLLLSATACVKIVEERLLKFNPNAQLIVFEQTFSGGIFTGLIRKNHSAESAKEDK